MSKIDVKMVLIDLEGKPKDEIIEVENWDARYPNDFKLKHTNYKYFQFSRPNAKSEYNDDWCVSRNCEYDGYFINGKKVWEVVVLFKKVDHV